MAILEIEPNDSKDVANVANLGATITGRLTSVNDIDYYAVSVATSGVLSINFDTLTNDYFSHYIVAVQNGNGALLGQSQAGMNHTWAVGAATSGTYFVSVISTSYAYDASPYSLTIFAAAGGADGFESESNDTRATANAISLAQPISAQLSSNADVDYYAVSLGSPGVLSIALDIPADNQNSPYFDIAAYDATGVLLGKFINSAGHTLSVGAPQAGTYYVGIFDSTGQYSLSVTATGLVPNGFESESNDTRATADALSLSTPIAGQLAGTSDVDYYAVSVNSPGLLTITFDTPTNSDYYNYYTVAAYDDAGTLLAQWTTGKDKAWTVGTPTTGPYYIAIASEPYSNSSAQYVLTASAYPGSSNGVESEPNNSPATADTLNLATPIAGQLSSGFDLDYYAVTVDGSVLLSIAFDAPSSNIYLTYYTVTAFDSGGTLLLHWYTGTDQTWSLVAPAAGTYYFGIQSSETYYYDSGQYSLTVSATAGDATAIESESNDTRSTADALSLSGQTAGRLSTAGDVDFYAVTLGSAGLLSAAFDAPGNNIYRNEFTIAAYDSGGVLLAQRQTGADAAFTVVTPVAGTYYLGISSVANNYNAEQYLVTATATTGNAIGYESESNDTRATADAASLAIPISGQLSTPSDVDYYAVNVEASGLLSIAFDAPANIFNQYNDNYYAVAAYDNAGVMLGQWLAGPDQTWTVSVPAPGKYYARVTSVANYFDDRAYSLTISAAAGGANGFENESNDTRATANALTPGVPRQGQLSSAGDVDYYSVTADSPGSMSVAFDMLTDVYNGYNYNYFTVSAYDSSGAKVLEWQTGSDQHWSATVPAAGTYYVGIAANTAHYNFVQYTVSVSTTAGSTNTSAESETNNTQSTATPLTLAMPMAGELTFFDTDFYQTYLGSSGTLTIELTGLSTYSYNYTVKTYDAAGTVLASWVDTRASHFQVPVGSAGYYYTSVNTVFSTGHYNLTESFVSSSNHAPVGIASISGNPYAGQTLAAGNDLSDEDGLGAINYQWQDSADGATWRALSSGLTLSLTPSLLGHQIRVVASYTDGLSTTEKVESRPLLVTVPGDIAGSTNTTSTLTVGSSVNSTIDFARDTDYFKVHLIAGTAYQFDLTGGASGSRALSDPYLTLHDQFNTTLRLDDDGASVYPFVTGSGGFSANAQVVFIAPQSQDYYLDVTGDSNTTGSYQLSATTLSADYYIQSILDQPNVRWNAGSPIGTPVNVTFSFPNSLPPEYSALEVQNYVPFSPEQKDAARQALQLIASYTNITFSEVSDLAGQIRFGTNYQVGTSGVTLPSSTGSQLTRADVSLANNDLNNAYPTSETRAGNTLVHEIEHALGLKHPGNYNAGAGETPPPYLPSSQDTSPYTIETYNQTAIDKTPMVFDIAALQYLYGANPVTQAGNSSYVVNTYSSSLFTLWDASGNDLLDASNWTARVFLDLNPGALSYTGYSGPSSPILGIAYNTLIENATGGSNSDTLLGNDADNSLKGGGGSDLLEGGAGIDTAIYTGPWSRYAIKKVEGGHSVTDSSIAVGSDGADTLFDIERLQFADLSMNLGINNAPLGMVSIDGTAAQGQTLSALNTLLDPDGLGVIAFQWQSSGNGTSWSNLSTGNSFLLTQVQVGKQIRVVASYTDLFGTVESVTSVATAPVVSVNSPPTVGTFGNQGAKVNKAVSISLGMLFSDPDGDVLSFAATGLPAGLSIDNGGTITGTAPDTTGTHHIKVTATDPGNASATLNFDLVITSDHTLTANVVTRGGLALPGVTAFEFASETAVGSLYGYRNISLDTDGGSGVRTLSADLVATGSSATGALDLTFHLNSGAGFTSFDLTGPVTAANHWTIVTNSSVANSYGLSAIHIGESIAANTVIGKLSVTLPATAPGSSIIDLTGATLGNDSSPARGLTYSRVDLGTTGQFSAPLPDSNVAIALERDTSDLVVAGRKPITAADALDALKLSVSLASSQGSSWKELIAADMNHDGRVTAADALEILKASVGINTVQPSWVFVPNDAAVNPNLGAMTRSSVSYHHELNLASLTAPTSATITGILVGDVNNSWQIPSV